MLLPFFLLFFFCCGGYEHQESLLTSCAHFSLFLFPFLPFPYFFCFRRMAYEPVHLAVVFFFSSVFMVWEERSKHYLRFRALRATIITIMIMAWFGVYTFCRYSSTFLCFAWSLSCSIALSKIRAVDRCEKHHHKNLCRLLLGDIHEKSSAMTPFQDACLYKTHVRRNLAYLLRRNVLMIIQPSKTKTRDLHVPRSEVR